MACCGYVGFLFIELVPIATAPMNIGLAGALYYYSTYHAGGPPEPELYFQQFVGFSVMGSVIGGVTSFFLCRVMR